MGWRTYRALVGAQLASAVNSMWRSPRARAWRAGGALLAVAGWLLTYWVCRRGIELLLLVPAGRDIALDLLQSLLVLIMVFLLFSGMLVALAHLYLAEDLRFLGTLPAGDATLYAVKWSEVTAISAALPALFALAVASGIGAALDAPPPYYGWAAVVLALFGALPTGVAVALSTAAVTVFPATRMRDGLVFLTLVLLLGVFLGIRAMRLETILTTESLADLPGLMRRFTPPGTEHTPAAWATGVLRPLLDGGNAPDWKRLGLLAAGAAGTFALGLTVFAALFRPALSRSLTARARAVGGRSHGAKLVALLTAPLPHRLRAVATKDLLTFARDPSQWSQLFLLTSLVLMYLLNISSLPIHEIRIAGLDAALMGDFFAFVNLGPLALILSAIAVRFLFASVSLEGKAVWIPLSSPLGASAMLRAKFLLGVAPLWLFGLLLAAGSNVLLGASAAGTLLAAGVVTLFAAGLGGLGVGIGAILPRFDAGSPARIAASLGGLVFMVSSLLYAALLLALLAYPALLLVAGAPSGYALALGIVSGGLALILTAAACLVPLHLGARALEKHSG